MGLKDLIAPKAAMDEAAIEAIVKDYVTYDVDTKTVTLMPAAEALSNKSKILVYLVALQGWPFVTDEPVEKEMKPQELEEHLRISGGTLRPTLIDLKERRLVVSESGAYSVRAAVLPTIKADLDGAGAKPARTTRRRPKRNGARADADDSADDSAEAAATPAAKRAKAKRPERKNSLAERFRRWISDGWFDDGRPMQEAGARFRKEGDMVPKTTLPKYFLTAVRDGLLSREEKEVNGRQVWVYFTVKK